MLTLFVRPGCSYCSRVLAANQTIGAPLTLRNIYEDAAAKADLIAKGGKTQVPFLDDAERGVLLYESVDIINHRRPYYGSGARPVVSQVGNVCPIE